MQGQKRPRDVPVREPLQLPPPEDVPRWLCALVARDGAEYVAHRLFDACPRDKIFAMCEAYFDACMGEAPTGFTVDYPVGGCMLSSAGLASPQLDHSQLISPRTTAHPRQFNRDVQSEPVFKFARCDFCEPCEFRPPSNDKPPCHALSLLKSIEAELDSQRLVIEREEAEEGESGELRRAARYYMYRQYVSVAYGHLGRGVRVRIPLCVVETIRDTFRAPGCDSRSCPKGGPLAACTRHGYTGHRDGAGM